MSARGALRPLGRRLTPCEVHDEWIAVRGRRRAARERVTITKRGPIVSPAGEDETPALSMRCALLDEKAKLTGPLRMQDLRSFRDLWGQASGWPFPLNVLYADEHGHIGWQLTGHIPRRDAGGDGAPDEPGIPYEGIPGLRVPSASHWDGWLTSEEPPSALDPRRGFLVTANNKPLPNGEGPYHRRCARQAASSGRSARASTRSRSTRRLG